MTKEISSGLASVAWKDIETKDRIAALLQLLPNSSASASEKFDSELKSLTKSYHKYKREYVKHLLFNPDKDENGESIFLLTVAYLFSGTLMGPASLVAVYIYFDTATYDKIERDVKVNKPLDSIKKHKHGNCLKVTVEAQLGLIGGTMGLLTGFSILSGVEIIYYLLRFPTLFDELS